MSRLQSAVLGFELAPLQDELLYGWLARHRVLLRLAGSKSFSELVLGRPSIGGTPFLPTGLRNLPSRLVSGLYDHERLLSEHTAFPYFASFGPADRIGSLREGMKNGWTDGGSQILGFTTVLQHKLLLYCRTCRAEQLSILGDATWNRIHQAPGVFQCHEHDEPLVSSPIEAVVANGLFTCPAHDIGSTPVASSLRTNSARRIARLTANFMRNPRVVSSRVQLRVGITNLLRDAGWVHESGHLRAHLWDAFAKHMGETALDELGCGRSRKKLSWIHDLVGAHTVGHHPLRYLMLFDFLGLNPDDLDQFPPPLSEMPTGAKAGTAARPPVDIKPPSPELLLHYRNGILFDRREGLTRAEIQRKFAVRFRAMMAFDRDWLDVHAPLPPPQPPRGMKDNSEEDDRLTAIVTAAIGRLKGTGDTPPKRLTISSIANEAGVPAFQQRKERLPKSLRLVLDACETVDEHRVTLLRWAAGRYRAEGWNPSFKVFAKRAAFHPERFPELRAIAREIHADLARSLSAGD